jgi:hypothetical protein
MSDTKVSGIVHLIEDTKEYGKNGFRKRLVVLEQENGSFTNYIPVEFLKDSCDTVDDMNVGDEVEVKYRLSGRRWQRDEASEVKFFLSAEAMSFKVTGILAYETNGIPQNISIFNLLNSLLKKHVLLTN